MIALLPLALSFLKKFWPFVIIAVLYACAWGYRKAYHDEQAKVSSMQSQYESERAAAQTCSDATAQAAKLLATKQATIQTLTLANTVATTQAQARSAQRVTTIEVSKTCDNSLSDLQKFYSQRHSPLSPQ